MHIEVGFFTAGKLEIDKTGSYKTLWQKGFYVKDFYEAIHKAKLAIDIDCLEQEVKKRNPQAKSVGITWSRVHWYRGRKNLPTWTGWAQRSITFEKLRQFQENHKEEQ